MSPLRFPPRDASSRQRYYGGAELGCLGGVGRRVLTKSCAAVSLFESKAREIRLRKKDLSE